jgi:hypothetical protein
MLAAYVLLPARREVLFGRITESLKDIDEVETHAEAAQLICRVDPGRREMAFLRLFDALAKDAADDLYVGHWEWLLALDLDLLPLVAKAYSSPDRDVRLYAILVIEQLVESREPERIVQPDGSAPDSWPIPPEVQPVLDRARNDSDPQVRDAAAGVGNPDSFPGRGGMGGGFFCLPSG